MKHLQGLNEKQKEAVLHKEGALLIVAGAGAGKTKTITHRIVNLIKEGVIPEKILAVTFTNKAAKEMRDRIFIEISSLSSDFSPLRPSSIPARSPWDPQRQKTERGGTFSSIVFPVPFVSTFHSLGVHIIKENARILGLNRFFTILDEDDTAKMIKESLKELSIDPKQYDPWKIKNIISREKGNFVTVSEYAEREKGEFGKIITQVWNLYEKRKQKENSLDFDDLLIKSLKLLKENEKIKKIYQERWQYIHVDEYQDTNEVQYLLTKILAESHGNICVVGDADQNIYSWRGANLKNILNFEKDFPKVKTIMLEENYRSTKNILKAANEVIKKNIFRPEKNLFTQNKVGEKISLYEALDEGDEAEFVAIKILEILDSSDSSNFSSLRPSRSTEWDPRDQKIERVCADIAVLYRANFQSRVLEEAMLRYNIPYQVLGTKFFERKEIRDTLAYLRASLNPESLSDIKRIINFPARGIGKATLAKIFAGGVENLPIKTKIKINNFYKILEEIKEKTEKEKASEVIKFIVKKTGIEEELGEGDGKDQERLENIKELATLAKKYDNLKGTEGIEKMLEDASLASDQDLIINGVSSARSREGSQRASTSSGVKLMTVHASKGLEFDYVFITGLEDGLFPSFTKASTYAQASADKSEGKPSSQDSEEERRLFYVALTRAKKKVFLSFADFRTIFGSRQINAPSEFIGDIPADLIEKEGTQLLKTIYI